MEKAVFKAVHNRKRREGPQPVEIYCYHLGKKKYISTGILVEENQWDKKKRQVNIRHPNHHRVNYRISQIITGLELHEMMMIDKTGRFTLDDLSKKKERPASFLAFMEEEIKSDLTVSTGTRKYRDRTLRYIKNAVGDISFKNLDYEAISEFDAYMAGIGLSVATRKNHHNQVRKFAQIAVYKRKLIQNPYVLYKVKKPPRGLKKCLWYEELDRLWELEYPNSHEQVRLKFLFACYTGLRISDVSRLKTSDIRGGKIFLTMKKTSMPVVVPLDVLSERGKLIYEKCQGEYVFEKMSDQKTNQKLKRIGIDAGIGFPLNFHVARHTFCTMVAHKTGSVFAVMRYAGITQVSTANVYVNLAKMFD